MRKSWLYIGIVLMGIGCSSKNEVEYTFDPVTNVAALWEIIDTKYCFVEEKKIDWQAIGEEYKKKAKELPTQSVDQVALFDLCAAMLDSLRDGHVNLYTPFDRSYNTAWYDTFPANYDSRLQALYLRDYRIAGGLYYCKVDMDSIGYVYYSSFSNSISNSNITWIIRTFKDCKGLIIDVRNNGGGELTNSYKLASVFFSEDRLVGYWQHKTGLGHNDFSELSEQWLDHTLIGSKWLRPVVVLTNRRSYSATNSFVSMMRYADNCTIVGGKTGGGGGMPMSYEMPCGWTVRFSSIRMMDRDKQSIEDGIAPNIGVNMVSKDKDDIIEKAIEVIHDYYKKRL